MEQEEGVLEFIYKEDDFNDSQDVEMLDVEEGEILEEDSRTELGDSSTGDVKIVNQDSRGGNRRRRKNKKNRRKKRVSAPNVTDIDRFVLATCRHLREKKSYMVYTAVGCLGVAALSELVREVDAVQACGGQMTADGQRYRTGGGILWRIIKTREPKAYKEIMKKTKEFEKQFGPQNIRQAVEQNNEASSERSTDVITGNINGSQFTSQMESHIEQSEEKRVSAHDRIRVPVSYDDGLLGEDPKDELH